MQFLPEEIEFYTEQHTSPENTVLQELVRETWQKVVNPRMLSGHVQGRFLSFISHLIKPKYILEIGTYTGYSAICLAEGLAPGGELITIDINDELKPIQDKYFAMSPDGPKIKRISGSALEVIQDLHQEFDLVFMDADKENYPHYYDMLLNRLKKGSVILIDNVLWSGKVLQPANSQDKETIALQHLNDLIQRDERVENVLVPLRDGLMMVRVL
ncbi:MAG: O-methyltransferase [Flavobacteriales bacterium]